MITKGQIKKCDIYGCHQSVEANCTCDMISVMVIPLYDVEDEYQDMEGTISFGNRNEVAPWTTRKLDGPVVKLVTPLTVEGVPWTTK